MGLLAREFAGVFDVGQVLMVSDDGDGVRCSLNILTPFCEGKDDCEQFLVIDVVVPFGRKEGAREVGIGKEITICIILEEDGTSCEQ